jgi:hypothetical protein
MNLTREEAAKLDPVLHKIFLSGESDESQLDVGRRKDGEKEYAVIIRTSDVEALRSSGITPGSVFDDVVTARVTKNELRKVLRLSAVRAVQNGSKNVLH